MSGTVTLTANATDNVAVTGVQFQLDGGTWPDVDRRGLDLQFSWNSTTAANGTHTLTAIASDAAGNTATSSVSVTVANDSTPPTVTMTSPSDGSSVTGTVNVSANASDSVGIAGVQFQLDGANLGGVMTGAGPSVQLLLEHDGGGERTAHVAA